MPRSGDPDRRCRDLVTQTGELAVDAAIAPSWVLVREMEDYSAELARGWRSSVWACRLGPVSGDAAAVPAKQGVGSDEPALTQAAGESGCDGAEQAPVIVVQVRSVDLASQHRELMAQDHDLEVLEVA